MKPIKHLRDGVKLMMLFGAVALVLWRLPEYPPNSVENPPDMTAADAVAGD